VKASLFLAAAAQAVNGEINALRIGIPAVAPGMPFAVCAVVEIPWVQAVDNHTLRLDLVEEDGTPFEFTTPDGETHTVHVESAGGTGIPAGHRVGSPRIVTLVGNFVLPLAVATRYEFRLSIDDETDVAWRIGFDTPPPPLGHAEAA
jgi:hypothetical protein